jgi:hypothetical protein
MIIHKPKLKNYINTLKQCYEINKNNNETVELWFEVDKNFGDYILPSCDAAMVALLIPAMHAGEDMIIKGDISGKLHFNLYRLQKTLQILIPSLKIIEIKAENLSEPQKQADLIATGFSGGIDSYSTLQDYFYNNQYAENKISLLTYHNVGTHVKGSFNTPFEQQNQLFESRYNRIKKVSSQLGFSSIPTLKINSNLDRFYTSPELNFENTHTLRNIAVSLLLQNGIKRFYFSAGYTYKDIKFFRHIDLDPIILPLLSTDNFEPITVGSEYSRVEKTLKISEMEDPKIFLDVCVNSHEGENCSSCFKCMRTLVTLDIIGKLDQFRSVFNIETYHSHKKMYLNKLLLDINPFGKEIIEYCKNNNKTLGSIDVSKLLYATEHVKNPKKNLIDSLFKNAQTFHKNKEITKAADFYRLVLTLDPNHRAAQFLNHIEMMAKV